MIQLKIRRRDGVLRGELNLARDTYREKKSFENAVEYARTLVTFFTGCRTAAFLHDRCFLYFYSLYRYRLTRRETDLLIKKICRTRFYLGNKKCSKSYPFPAILQYTRCEKSVLYHMTPTENRVSIMAQGLKPGKKPFVYMADSLDFFTGVRSTWFGENPVLFEIDAERLQALGHTVYRTADGEYVTDCVERECLKINFMQRGELTENYCEKSVEHG